MTLVADLPKQASLPQRPELRPSLERWRNWSKGLVPLLLPVTVIAGWQLASSLGLIGSRLMPAPLDVVYAFWDKASSGQLAVDVLASAQRAVSGLLVGGSIGFALLLLAVSSDLRLGAIAVPREDYRQMMQPLLTVEADFAAFDQDDEPEAVLAWARGLA